ncbi:MAG: 1,4-alpha-glucan branching protein domain-containing protein [Nitrospirota bacterium]
MHKGYLILILHAHLPYIRHPEHEYFLEENWLYEAITESYMPLIDVFDRLLNDNIDFRITLSLSPTLVEMFNDSFLRERYLRYINNLIELSEKELLRTRGDISFEPLVRMYNNRFKRVKFLYEESCKKDLTAAFKRLGETGKAEIITTAATHSYLPVLSIYPQAVRAQIRVAKENHIKNFGKAPAGIWLPECGYYNGADRLLAETGIRFFFMDTHGILNGMPTPRYGVYKPVSCPSGVIAFGRDIESSKQVWSSIEGYPGDFAYRDFYRDAGFDLPIDYVKPHIHPDGIRTYTGIKYYRITGKTEDKMPYVRKQALAKAEEHAENFMSSKKRQIEFLYNTVGFKPVITAPYDTELFGHWWFEGPDWLDSLMRRIAGTQDVFRTITPTEYLSEPNPPSPPFCKAMARRGGMGGFSGGDFRFQYITPSMSSWGYKGYNEVWLNSSNSWIYRHLHRAVEKMIELANMFPQADGLLKRALNQAAREVLLSQYSDWAFIIKTGAAAEYASKRLSEHIERFNGLYAAIRKGDINEARLFEIENKDKLFSEMDYRVYSDSERRLSKG